MTASLLRPMATICFLAVSLPTFASDNWLDADIGDGIAKGGHVLAGSALTVSGAGKGERSYEGDQLHYTYLPMPAGDVEITARIVSISADPHARAGLMLRTSNDRLTATTAQAVLAYQDTNEGLHNLGFTAHDAATAARSSSGIATRMELPIWLRLVRIGKDFGVYKSADGKIWSMCGNTSGWKFVPNEPIEAGLFVAGGDPAKTASAVFDSIAIGKPNMGYRSSWVGASYSQDSVGHVSGAIGALWTTPDGTCYTNNYWDEGALSANSFKDGKVAASHSGINKAAEGSITSDGARVAYVVEKGLQLSDAKFGKPVQIHFLTDLWDAKRSINVTSGMTILGNTLYIGNARDNKILAANLDYKPFYTAGNSSTNVSDKTIETKGVANAAPAAVYQTQRECDYLPYRIPNLEPGASYTVRAHFAEYTEDKPGRRLINIGAGGQNIRGFDIVAAAGGPLRAVVKDLPEAKPDPAGVLFVVFERGEGGDGHIVINALELLKADGTPAFRINCGGAAIDGFQTDVSELPERAFPFTRPGPMTADKRDELWIIQEANDFPVGTTFSAKYPPAIRCYRTDGTYTGRQITDVANPTGMAYDAKNDRLLVADNGPDQNVRIFDNLAAAPKLAGTFGQKGGLWAGKHPGLLFDPEAGGWARFYGLTGVGVDAEGDIYVAGSYCGADLRKFTPDGKLVWKILGLEFCNTTDIDPDSDGAEAYSAYKHYTLDLAETQPGSEWRYAAYTWNPVKYGPPPRQGNSQAIVRRLGPQRTLTLFTSGQGSIDTLNIFRFDGEITVLCGTIREKGPNIEVWTDANADGLETPDEVTGSPRAGGFDSLAVDRKGDVWITMMGDTPVLRHFKLKGLNPQGVPLYGTGKEDCEDAPFPGTGEKISPWGQHAKVNYDCDNDVMYLVGPAKDRKTDKDDCVAYLARYDNWSKGNRTARWLITLPNPDNDPNFMYEIGRPWGCPFHWMGFDVAGDKIFLAELWGPIHVYDATTGKLEIILNAGPEVSGCNAWEDANLGLRAFKRKNGEYLIFSENSGFFAKINMFRWKP